MRLLFALILLFIIGFQWGCGSNKVQDIGNYYYPLSALERGVVYEYQSTTTDTLPEEYWYFRSIYTDSMDYLTANYYDHNFIVRQFTTEEIVVNGSIIKDYFLYGVDSLGFQTQIPGEIKSATAFPFEVRDSGGIFLTHLKWTFQEAPEISTTVIKNRRYRGKTTYEFKGKKYDCVVFELKELVDDFNNGHWEKQYDGKEIYAKGLGLIYYEKKVDDNFMLSYELVDTFAMTELEKRFRGTMGFHPKN